MRALHLSSGALFLQTVVMGQIVGVIEVDGLWAGAGVGTKHF